jgi:hypothetical protein
VPGLARGRSVRLLCALERKQKPAANLERVIERLEPGRAMLPLLPADVGLAGARSDDQKIIRHAFSPIVELHDAFGDGDAGHVAEHHGSVPLATEHCRNWNCNIGGRQHCCRDLVQQRLKEVVIGPVDEGHTARRTTESTSRL